MVPMMSKPRLTLVLIIAISCALLSSQWSTPPPTTSTTAPVPQVSDDNAPPSPAPSLPSSPPRSVSSTTAPLLLVATVHPRAPQQEPVEEEVAPAVESSSSSSRYPPLLWTGGGVTGPTAHDTRNAIRLAMSQFRDEAHNAACSLMLEDRSGEELVHALDALKRVVLELASVFTEQGLRRDDCWIHLTPQQRAMCAVLASVDDDEREAAKTGGGDVDARRAYLMSYCSTMTPCLQWKAGRFSYPLNGSFLLDVYRQEVVPLVTEHHENRQAVDAVSHIFAHDEDDVDVEACWIVNRTILQEELLGRHQALFDAFQREVDHEKQKKPLVLTDEEQRHLEWARSPVQGVANAAFLGHQMTFDARHREVRVSSRETGEEVTLQHYSPLQAMALMYRKVVAGYTMRKQYLRPTAEDRDDRLMDEPTFRPYMNLIVFSGDSMNREFFLRLVFHFRFGREPPIGNPHLRQTPFHEPSQQHDMIYSVFEDHDDLDVFHSLMSNGKSGRTVSAFFQTLKWDMRRWERFPETLNQRAGPRVALFYVVYFWDPQTDYYRREMLPMLPLLTTTMHTWAGDIINATDSLDDVAAGRGHLRIDEVHQKQKVIRDSNEVAMIMPGQPCIVRLRMSNGREKLIDIDEVHQKQKVIRDSNEVAMIMPGQPCIVRLRMSNGREKLIDVAPNGLQPHQILNGRGNKFTLFGRESKGRMLQPASSVSYSANLKASYGGFTLRTGCSPDRAAAAIRLRETYLSRHRHRFGVKPPTPLRDIGIRVPVHIQGNVFWEYTRNVQMTQHQYATLLATDNDVSHVPHLPRRATPKDQTEMYMFSSSFHENLQPYLRGLSPFYRKFLEDEAAMKMCEGNLENAADVSDEDNGEAAVDEQVVAGGPVVLLDDAPSDGPPSGAAPAPNNTGVTNSSLSDEGVNFSTLSSPTSLLAYFQQTYPGQPIKSILKQYRLTSETHHNLIKNVQQLLWFQSVRDARRRILILDAARRRSVVDHHQHNNTTTSTSTQTPFRYVESMTLLEMGKLQALGFVQGDTRHFSCRYTQVKDKIRFRSSFEAFGIRNVLSLGSHRSNTEQRFCRTHHQPNNSSKYQSSSRSSSTIDNSSMPHEPSQQQQSRLRKAGASLDDVVDMFVELFSPSPLREELWKLTKMEEVERQTRDEDPVAASEKIMHFQDYKEYGVIVHDDESRCIDDANLFLLEVLLNKMVLRDLDKASRG
ncbi:Hypothetical protein, putative [Bodo saltans]|uniref:Membrane-associated protein n=1 Tax=Bodo saltans TaxID=75058 RepID=A0A0S4JDH5_BODSA|nr:Hypothetical protein, putative [Bodo saltans]|eukprot:CUG88203.1 Hypothetical protein, putative [Bodo saltans]